MKNECKHLQDEGGMKPVGRPFSFHRLALFLLKLTVSAGLLFLVFSRLDIEQAMQALLGIPPLLLLAAFALCLLSHYVRSFQNHIIAGSQGLNFSPRQFLDMNLITMFYSLLAPGNLAAGGAKWYMLQKPEGKRAQALALIVLARSVDTFVLLLLGITALFLYNPFNYSLLTTALALLALGLSVCFAVILSPKLFGFTTRFVVEPLCRAGGQWLGDRLRNIWIFLQKFRELRLRAMFCAFALSLAAQLVGVCGLYILGLSLGIQVSYLSFVWIGTVTYIVHMLPISISGLGVREVSLIYMLGAFAVPNEKGLAFSLAIFAIMILFGLMGLVLVLLQLFGKAPTVHTQIPQRRL